MVHKFYEDSFNRMWRQYGLITPGPDGSKQKAYSAWNATSTQRPSEETMSACIDAYREELDGLNKGKSEGFQRQKLHFSTFLSPKDSRWESYLDRAEAILARKKAIQAPIAAATYASRQTWPEDVVRRLGLSEAMLNAWVFPCVLRMGSPPQIIAPKKMIQNYLLAKLPTKIERALGPGVVVTCG